MDGAGVDFGAYGGGICALAQAAALALQGRAGHGCRRELLTGLALRHGHEELCRIKVVLALQNGKAAG